MRRRWRVVAVVAVVAGLAAYSTRSWSLPAFAGSLICTETSSPASTLVLDNFDYPYALFKRGGELQRAGAVSRVLIPMPVPDNPDAGLVARETAKTFSRLAGLSPWEFIPVREEEPISLNAALRVRDLLQREQITSITLVSDAFRSRRSELIYRAVLDEAGIGMTCLPVPGGTTVETWTDTWHGIQSVVEQFLKLQYYRLWVLPGR